MSIETEDRLGNNNADNSPEVKISYIALRDSRSWMGEEQQQQHGTLIHKQLSQCWRLYTGMGTSSGQLSR